MLTLESAKKIVTIVARRARGLGRVQALLENRDWQLHLGNMPAVDSIDRTIDDLAGHRDEDGKWVGAARIRNALALTARAYAH